MLHLRRHLMPSVLLVAGLLGGCSSDGESSNDVGAGATPTAGANDQPHSIDSQLINDVRTRLAEVSVAAGAVRDGEELRLDDCVMGDLTSAISSAFEPATFERGFVGIGESGEFEEGCKYTFTSSDTLQSIIVGYTSFALEDSAKVSNELSEFTRISTPDELAGEGYEAVGDGGHSVLWVREGIIVLVGVRTAEGIVTDPAPDLASWMFGHLHEWLTATQSYDPFLVQVVSPPST